MKQKTASATKPVIETILDKKFDESEKRMEQKFVTKGDMQVAFLDFRLEMDKKFEKMDENARIYRDQILAKMDGVMGELENHRIEQNGIKQDIKDLKKHFTN